MLELVLGFLVLLSDQVDGKLKGPNVCQDEHRYTINVTEYFVRNTTVRNYEWCINVPPRCSFYTTKPINQSRIVEKQVTELVDKCCSGFVKDKDGSTCLPVCPKCVNGNCVEGKCWCESGFKGLLCDSVCDSDEWGTNCKFKCNCIGSCDSKTGTCDCFSGCNSCDPVGRCLTTTSSPITIPVKTNGKFFFSTTTDLIITETSFPQLEQENRKIPSTDLPSPMLQTTRTRKNLQIVDDDEYLDEDVGKDDLVNGASAATAISVGIIIVAAMIVATRHFRGRKENQKKRSNGVSTVAVYTHSIFHTPLPEPPQFEGPIILTPLDTNIGSNNEGRFETHVVCSMNFPTQTVSRGVDPRDYLYDHPPSTGSYRAASIPDPDVDPKIEPVYDEIPAGITPISEPPPSYKSPSNLYVNTFGKTRF